MDGPDIKRLYYSTQEVCRLARVRSYDLKQWEKKFSELKPSISKTGRRLYKPGDLEIISKIKSLADLGKTDDEIQYLINHPQTPISSDMPGRSEARYSEIIGELENILKILKSDSTAVYFD
ncbi:MerR family transcriptional regulator [bacterium]|nr:MerR family transcriptional regulator [bacterium]